MKRSIVVFFALLLFWSCWILMPDQVQAAPAPVDPSTTPQETVYTEGCLQYTLSDGKATIINYKGTLPEEYTFPTKVNGYPVVAINNGAIKWANSKTITIPANITKLGNGAFHGCYFETMRLHNGLKELPGAAFQNCERFSWMWLPKDLKAIPGYLFCNCTGMSDVLIPAGVTSIGDSSFKCCTSLTALAMPEKVNYVDAFAFQYSKNMDALIFTGDAPEFHKYAFNSFDITVYYPAGNTTWTDAVKQNYTGTASWRSYRLQDHLSLRKFDGVWVSCVMDAPVAITGMVRHGGGLYYVKDGKADLGRNGLYQCDGVWYYLKSGKVAENYTGLYQHSGSWYYIKSGKLDRNYTGLIQHSGSWYYVKSGVVNLSYTSLVKYNGEWWYVVNGKVASSTTGLIKYNGEWWYVVKGKLAAKTTTLVKYNGEWFYVVKGKMAGQTTSLVKYNNEWWYIVKGKIAAKTTTLVKYNGSWYYIVKGKMAGKTSTLVKHSGKWYYVVNGCVSNQSTLCLYNNVWYHVNNGTTTKETTLCRYGNQWYYVKNGVFSESTLFFRFPVDNVNYYVKDGVVMTGTSGQVVVGGKTYYVYKGALTNCHSVGHSWKNATCSSPKTCAKCTVTTGSALAHSWKSATCTSPKTCSYCGTISGSALGHTLVNGTCSRCGVYMNTTLYEDSNIKITFSKIEKSTYDNSEAELYFNVQNKTGITLLIQADSVSLNGYSFSDLVMSDPVAAYSTGRINVTIDNFDFNLVNINKITHVGAQLRIINDGNWSDHYNAIFNNVKLDGSGTGSLPGNFSYQNLLYSDNECAIYYKSIEKSTYDDDRVELYLYVQNKTSHTLLIQADTIALNGYSFDDLIMSDPVLSNTIGIVNVSIDSFDFSLVNINNISRIGGQLRIINDLSWGDTYKAKFTNVSLW